MSTAAATGLRVTCSCAIAALTALVGSAVAARQLTQTTITSQTSIITPISRTVYTAALEASFDR
jgi:hypothetical protein